MNYKQNLLGPIEDKSKPRFNIMEVTADRYEDFVCNFDGTIIKYDIDVATKHLRTRNNYEARHQREDYMGTPQSPRAYGRYTREGSDDERVKMRPRVSRQNTTLNA